MSSKTVVPLVAVLVLAVAGCSEGGSHRTGQAGTPQTAPLSSSAGRTPSGATATEAASPGAAITSEVCQGVDAAAYGQLIAMSLAIGDRTRQGAALRADVARTYEDFAARLTLIRAQAVGRLSAALTQWASAGTAVGHYVAEKKPRPGLVIDYGPTEKRWDATQKATEKICGHDLPDLSQGRKS